MLSFCLCHWCVVQSKRGSVSMQLAGIYQWVLKNWEENDPKGWGEAREVVWPFWDRKQQLWDFSVIAYGPPQVFTLYLFFNVVKKKISNIWCPTWSLVMWRSVWVPRPLCSLVGGVHLSAPLLACFPAFVVFWALLQTVNPGSSAHLGQETSLWLETLQLWSPIHWQPAGKSRWL